MHLHLYLTAVLSIIGCAYLSQAAECYAQSGGAKCVNGGALKAFGPTWCNANFASLQGGWTDFPDAAGNIAQIGKIGVFPNPATCIAAFNDILSCYGKRNGGSWTWGGVSLNINFCQWPVALPVEFRAQDCSL
jgi:alpha-galactosyl binding lectin